MTWENENFAKQTAKNRVSDQTCNRSASRDRSLSGRNSRSNMSRNLSTGELSSASERSVSKGRSGNFALASVNHLEVPAELAFIFSKMERWRPAVHLEKSLSKVSGQVPGEI